MIKKYVNGRLTGQSANFIKTLMVLVAPEPSNVSPARSMIAWDLVSPGSSSARFVPLCGTQVPRSGFNIPDFVFGDIW